MEGVLKPVINLINKGTSYEEIMTDMASAYPAMDAIALEDMLARAIFVAECWGRMTAKN
jgi:phage gp29-like protein